MLYPRHPQDRPEPVLYSLNWKKRIIKSPDIPIHSYNYTYIRDLISALESVALGCSAPYAYYTDWHSIFRFVQGRGSFWGKHYLVTDDVDPQ